jgi:AraC-like DNA-binding protein/quercetin dioxygenase-like cupin family protein
MSVPPQHRRSRSDDHADVVALDTALGARVELMRTSYHTQVFPRHTHEYFTLGVVLRGAGTLWCRGSTQTTLPGDVVAIPPGEVHTGGPARNSRTLSYLAVHVPLDVLEVCADAHGIRGGEVPEFTSVILHNAALAAALRRLNTLMTNPTCAPSRLENGDVDEALGSVIGLLVSQHASSSNLTCVRGANRQSQVVRIAREIIDDCYADNARTSLRALALRAGVTPYHLVRVFTQTVGLSPHRYLVQTRVRRARELLAAGTPASFVAAMTGFVDQSHLTTQFKRYVGTTPVWYQRCVASRPGSPRLSGAEN